MTLAAIYSTNPFVLSFELLHGNAAFKPPEWVIRVLPRLSSVP